MASKEYQTAGTDIAQDLYWPVNAGNIDMLKIDIYKFQPISNTDVTTTISNVQSRGQKNTLATVLLPVPEGINYTDALSWGEEGIGALGKLLGSAAKEAAGGNASGLAEKLQKMAGSGMAPLLLKELSKVTGVNAEAVTQGAAGVVLNPYKEQIFQGLGMRNFNFTWKLVPRNATEQLRIHNIIKALRYYALPMYSGKTGLAEDPDAGQDLGGLTDRWLTVPNTFQLKWIYANGVDIQSLPKIKPCVLKNVTVNYTPDGVWATHMTNLQGGLSGPAPVAYNVTLDFAETEIITADDVLSINGAY